jgi:hypothetical protein
MKNGFCGGLRRILPTDARLWMAGNGAICPQGPILQMGLDKTRADHHDVNPLIPDFAAQ